MNRPPKILTNDLDKLGAELGLSNADLAARRRSRTQTCHREIQKGFSRELSIDDYLCRHQRHPDRNAGIEAFCGNSRILKIRTVMERLCWNLSLRLSMSACPAPSRYRFKFASD